MRWPSPWRLSAVVVLTATMALVAASARAQAGCTVQVTEGVQFGTYDALATGELDTTGNLRISCQRRALNLVVRITEGSSGTFSPRRMFSGQESIDYNLYLDAAHTIVWGDGSSGTSVHTEAFLRGELDLTVYARAGLGQDVSAGLYSDTVTVVVEF